jgi:pantetheine-phosphate adenylyltransferase
MKEKRIAVYPGSFDPVTNGHLDIAERAAEIFDEVVMSIAINIEKDPLFTIEERIEMLKETTKKTKIIKVDYFNGLLINYLKRKNCNVIIKGLRAVSDFEIEYQMALINKKLSKNVETVFLVCKAEYTFLSSRIVKEVASFGGDVSGLVPEIVKKKLKEKFKERRKRVDL